MAVWQYDLFLVGKENVLPLLMDDGWELPQLPAASTLSAQGNLIGSMGYPWLMMADWVVFGSEDSTRIDLIFDDVASVEIRIRLDASATDSELEALCSFSASLDCRLFDPANRTLLLPDRSSLASALAASRAAAFARGPRRYISDHAAS
jgi:hypothetical protein